LGFKLSEILNDASNAQAAAPTMKITNIPIESLMPDNENFYNVSDVDVLRESITMIGLQQPIEVRPAQSSKYIITSGHRRYKAIFELYSAGAIQWEQVPCIVKTDESGTMNELRLILANSTARQLTDYEKMTQATKLRELLGQLKSEGYEIKGRLREVVAEQMGVGKSTVGTYEQIEKNLCEQARDAFRRGEINITRAAELSRMPEQEQAAELDKPAAYEVPKSGTNQRVSPQRTNEEELAAIDERHRKNQALLLKQLKRCNCSPWIEEKDGTKTLRLSSAFGSRVLEYLDLLERHKK
jgi:ParB family chromosome partitioning protein